MNSNSSIVELKNAEKLFLQIKMNKKKFIYFCHKAGYL